MLQFLLPFIPTIVKAIAGLKETKNGVTKPAPFIEDVIGVSINPAKNKKAFFAALLTLLAAYGYKLSPEWLGFAQALWPYIAAYALAFLASKAPKKAE